MKTTKLVVLVSVIAFIMSSCGSYTSTEVSLKDDRDSASYFIGYFFGNQMVGSGMSDPNIQAVIAGINSAVQKKEMSIDMNEMQTKISEYMQTAMAKVGEDNLKKGEAFLAENAKKEGVQTLEGGVQYKVLQEGTGAKPLAEDKVKVHYVGTVISGEEFDSSVKRGEPAEFYLNQVIKGWTMALQEMTVGSKWIIYIPSDLGYGTRGAGGLIGPNEVLIFEVELLEIVKEEQQ